MKAASKRDLMAAIDEEIRRSDTSHVLVVSSRVWAAGEWFEELSAASRAMRDAAMAAPHCEERAGARRHHSDARPTFRGLAEAASRHRAENRGSWQETEDLKGVCFLINRDLYVKTGGISPEFRSGAVWYELAQRMRERGYVTGRAGGSLVHVAPGRRAISPADKQEWEAVSCLAEARSHLGQSQLDSSLASANQALKWKPDFAQALYHRSLIRAREGRWVEAEDDLLKALEVNPGFVRARNSLGCLIFELGRDAEAESHFREALRHEPGDTDIGRNLADLCFSRGDWEGALAVYQEMVRHHPDDPQIYLDLGDWCGRLGDMSCAADWYRKALELSPDCEGARARLAEKGVPSSDSASAPGRAPALSPIACSCITP